jgi:hypothetical protein
MANAYAKRVVKICIGIRISINAGLIPLPDKGNDAPLTIYIELKGVITIVRTSKNAQPINAYMIAIRSISENFSFNSVNNSTTNIESHAHTRYVPSWPVSIAASL